MGNGDRIESDESAGGFTESADQEITPADVVGFESSEGNQDPAIDLAALAATAMHS